MTELYYKEKLIKLFKNLYLSTKDARKKFIENEELWQYTYQLSVAS